MTNNERDIFDSLTANLRNEFEDPVGHMLRQAVADVENEINNTPNISVDAIDDGIKMLNQMLEQHDLFCEFVVVSGRLRIQEQLRDEDDGTIPDEVLEELRLSFADLGELHKDDEGYFFSVSNLHALCGNIDREMTTDNKCRLYLNLSADVDAEDLSDTALYMNFEDMVLFAPAEASLDKIQWEMRNNYSDIAEQIDTLPTDARTSEVFKALQKLDLTIDWSAYPYLDDMGKSDLIEKIQDYITSHVNIDTTFHSINVDGVVYAYDYGGNLLQSEDASRVLSGHIGRINLSEGETDENGLAHYTFETIVYQPVLGHRGGYEVVHVPIEIIGLVKNHRPRKPLFDAPVARLASEFISKGAFHESETTYPSEAGDSEPEIIQREAYNVSDRGESMLRTVDERLKSLTEICTQVAGMRFNDDAEAGEYLMKVNRLYAGFVEAASQRPCMYEVSGPGLMKMNISSERNVEKDEDNADITLKVNIRGMDHDDFTSVLGQVSRMRSFRYAPKDDPDKIAYKFTLSMYRNDKEPEQFSFQFDDAIGFTLSSRETFQAVLDSSLTQISIPEADRLYAVDELILKMADQFADNETLPWDLDDLKKAVFNIPSDTFDDFTELELLKDFALKATGDASLLQRSRQILRDLFYTRITSMNGTILDSDGDEIENDEIAGLITDVVTDVNGRARNEPMFEVREVTTNMYFYVPVSTLGVMEV